jgi:membrane AbrB-like protein
MGWKCFERLNVPAPTILGPMFVLAATNLFDINILVPSWLKPLLSIIMGICLGLRFNLNVKGVIREIIIVGIWIIVISIITANVLIYTGLTRATALFSSLPGGLTELSLVAMSFEADTFVVALLQSSRLLITMLVIPLITKRVTTETEIQSKNKHQVADRSRWVGAIIVGIISAYLFGLVRVPASNLIGPMIGVGILVKLKDISLHVNPSLQKYLQIGVGGLIGLNSTKESILGIPDYVVPIICLNVLIVGGCILLGFVLHSLTGWDLTTCLLSTSPAGLTPMILLSMELNADSNHVAIFQILRLTTVIFFAPLGAHIFLTE